MPRFDQYLFGQHLRRICATRGISVAKMCSDVGLHRSWLNALERNGNAPNGAALAALCKWGGLSAQDYAVD